MGRLTEGSNPSPSAARAIIRPVNDHEAMGLALEEAARAMAHGDVPVGAVVLTHDGTVVARRHNEREAAADPTAHAEILALRDAAATLRSWRLTGCTLVVTLEPCLMCAGAAVAARLAKVVFATPDPKGGAAGSLYNVCCDPRLNWEAAVVPGVRADEAKAQLATFFTGVRSRP